MNGDGREFGPFILCRNRPLRRAGPCCLRTPPGHDLGHRRNRRPKPSEMRESIAGQALARLAGGRSRRHLRHYWTGPVKLMSKRENPSLCEPAPPIDAINARGDYEGPPRRSSAWPGGAEPIDWRSFMGEEAMKLLISVVGLFLLCGPTHAQECKKCSSSTGMLRQAVECCV